MKTEINDFKWYECIEEPVRDLVYVLRNNGFNTECSCGHDMYIQLQYITDGEIHNLYKLICDYLYENNKAVSFDIVINIICDEGHQTSSIDIRLNSDN